MMISSDNLWIIYGESMDNLWDAGWWWNPTPLKKIRVRQLG